MSNDSDKKNFIKSIAILCVLLFIGVVFLSIGISLTVKTQRKIQAFVPTTAVVIGYKVSEAEDKKDTTTYAEIAEFTLNGKTYTVTNNVSSSNPKKIGTELTIYYNPDNPDECVFLTSNNFVNGFILIFSSVYLTAVILGIVFDCNRYRRTKALKKQLSSTTTLSKEDSL